MDFINFLNFYDGAIDSNERQGLIERLDANSHQNLFLIYSNQDFLVCYQV